MAAYHIDSFAALLLTTVLSLAAVVAYYSFISRDDNMDNEGAGVPHYERKVMTRLYRGVSKELDLKCNGELRPKGYKKEVIALHDKHIEYDGKFTHGPTEDNMFRAHHIETGLYGGCGVSTTRKECMATVFATTEKTVEGWVYVIDESKFKQYGVESKVFPDPKYPEQYEITIRAADCGVIPYEIVIEKYEVDKNGIRKNKAM